MASTKQQLADKVAKKALSLGEKVKFSDFAKGDSTLGCKKLAEKFKIAKIGAPNIIKEKKKIGSQHELLKNLRNEIALTSIEKLMRSYASGTRVHTKHLSKWTNTESGGKDN